MAVSKRSLVGFSMIIVTAAPLESRAQTTSATLRGRIADEQRAVLPGATVTAHQLDTNTSRTS